MLLSHCGFKTGYAIMLPLNLDANTSLENRWIARLVIIYLPFVNKIRIWAKS